MSKKSLIDFLAKPTAAFGLLASPFYFLRFFWFALIRRSARYLRYYPGHFASLIPDGRDMLRHREVLFNKDVDTIPGIDLRNDEQVNLLGDFTDYYAEFPFPENEDGAFRYYHGNHFYRFYDGFILYAMIRRFQPKRVTEIGSGFSSALVMDLNEREFENGLELTFIEPYPDRLNQLIREPDKVNSRIITDKIQDVGPEVFQNLKAGDMLLIDTSHVLKMGSDLSKIFFELIPRVPKGVIIHIHDIFWPFEYPEDVVLTGRLWNECYLTRAFLQFNRDFEILLFNDYLAYKHPGLLAEQFPECFASGGCSLWLRKTG